MVHNSAVELASPLFRRKRKRGNMNSCSSARLQSFSIFGRRYSASSSRRFSPFFSDCFERRKMVYVGASIQHKTALDAVFAEYGFTWDAGNRITEFETVDGTAEYTYDKTGQLTGADYDYITDELYTYDDNGNRTNAGYVTGDNNETLSDGTYRYSYDNEGNRIEKFLWTDTNNDGIIDASEKTLVQTYEWDYRNRLSSVTNYENGIAKEVMDYLYDYLNLLIERTVTDAATSILQSSDFNIYSNGQVVLEYDTTSSVDVVKSVNLWGANIDELVAVEMMAQSVNDNNIVLWTYGDHLNSIRDVLIYDSITQTATVVNHLIYNAFGVLVSSTDGSANPIAISPLLKFRYTGKYFDDSTGLQNNINRWYDNTTGKWISVDPIGFKGGDANLYRYVSNKANKSIDRLGLAIFGIDVEKDEKGKIKDYQKIIISDNMKIKANTLINMSDSQWKCFFDKGGEILLNGEKVEFDKVFHGVKITRKEFVNILKREFMNVNNHIQYGQQFDNLNDFQKNFRNVVGNIRYDWDIIFFATHGSTFDFKGNSYSVVHIKDKEIKERKNIIKFLDQEIILDDISLVPSWRVRLEIIDEVNKQMVYLNNLGMSSKFTSYFIACQLPISNKYDNNVLLSPILLSSDLSISYRLIKPNLYFTYKNNCLKTISIETARLELYSRPFIASGGPGQLYNKNDFMIIDDDVIVQEIIFGKRNKLDVYPQ